VSCMINHRVSYEIRAQGLKNQQNYRGFSHACSAQYRDSARSNGAGLGGVVIWNGGFVDKSSASRRTPSAVSETTADLVPPFQQPLGVPMDMAQDDP